MIYNHNDNEKYFTFKYIKELICSFVIISLFLFYTFFFKEKIENKQLAENLDLVFFLFSIGVVHILASNVLSFVYNQQRLVSPLAMRATPGKLKIVGAIVCLFGFLIFLVKF